jgi:acyl-coenzyme A synthetase/AMP-(fatty) acid ligase
MAGYWQRPELDERCFVERGGQRWYRTGDIVRADTDGVLHFLGRSDTRVKVRGIRIELESIESVLSDAPGVDSAVVGVSEDANGIQTIVAWVLLEGTAELAKDDLVRWCATTLPGSAVPTDIRQVTSFSQTPTGKIDRRTLRDSLKN